MNVGNQLRVHSAQCNFQVAKTKNHIHRVSFQMPWRYQQCDITTERTLENYSKKHFCAWHARSQKPRTLKETTINQGWWWYVCFYKVSVVIHVSDLISALTSWVACHCSSRRSWGTPWCGNLQPPVKLTGLDQPSEPLVTQDPQQQLYWTLAVTHCGEEVWQHWNKEMLADKWLDQVVFLWTGERIKIMK